MARRWHVARGCRCPWQLTSSLTRPLAGSDFAAALEENHSWLRLCDYYAEEDHNMKTVRTCPRRTKSRTRRPRRSADRMITDVDRRRLGTLISNREGRAWCTTQSIAKLEALLEDAEPVVAADAPETLVTMNTKVELADLNSEAHRHLTVVYPQDAEDVPNAASVVEPLGLALIGCRLGDVLQCPGEGGHVLRIEEIVYQPERAGAHNL
jgi:regulator of nucleoside diphosphate kinase